MNEEVIDDTTVPLEGNKFPQQVPDWVKITEIPHPALVPGFISRRECLPDGSLDPNTPSVTTQMSLLQASNLSPSLSSLISNIPSGLMCESIHKKNMRDVKEEDELKEGFILTHAPSHYQRAAEGNSINAATQTTSELAAINILYGGVRGKAYLNSLKSFVETAEVSKGSKIEGLLRGKLENAEAVCGFKIFKFKDAVSDDIELIIQNIRSLPLIDQNHELCRLLNTEPLDESHRTLLLSKLRSNLEELMRECPEEVKRDKFRGVSMNII